MKMGIDTPFLSYDHIQAEVDDFLQTYHSSKTIPIPIEEIIEFQLKINIIPIPGLQDLIHTAGFTSHNLKNISVDEYVQSHREGRYRFTLAHEVGHIFLHEDFLSSARFGDAAEWKVFVDSIPEKEYSKFEFQADEFAGRVLVPRDELISRISDNIKLVENHGLSIQENFDLAWTYILKGVADTFLVSSEVIRIRTERERIRDLLINQNK